MDGLKDELEDLRMQLEDLRTELEDEIAMRQDVTKDNEERIKNIEKEIEKVHGSALRALLGNSQIMYSLTRKLGKDIWEYWNEFGSWNFENGKMYKEVKVEAYDKNGNLCQKGHQCHR